MFLRGGPACLRGMRIQVSGLKAATGVALVRGSLRAGTRSLSTGTDSLIELTRIRNVAIIAHVDHGKTSLVDQLLKQSGAAAVEGNARVMDSNDLEKERGITILSKSTCVTYKDHRINIVDTPGHADFGGEVERVLSMVDGVVLVVCATEGPMTQTKFVLEKALARGLKPLVVLNKVDRPSARVDEVDAELLDLFLNLEATDEQTEYPIIFASAKEGWATKELEGDRSSGVKPLLDTIIDYVPAPTASRDEPFSMLVTQIESNPYLGKCFLGRIHSGVLRTGDRIKSLDNTTGKISVEGRCTKMLVKRGLEQIAVDVAGAGDIVSVAGIEGSYVNHTICAPEVENCLPFVPVDPPTISMMFYVNDSPLAGTDGKFLTSQLLRDRLLRELETNPAIKMTELPGDSAFEVRGRGELQMGVLIETMRREGFELSVSPPRVIYKSQTNDKGERVILEPVEQVTIDCNHTEAGTVIEKMSARKGVMETYGEASGDLARLIFNVPTRGLLGYPAEFKSDTSGQGTLNHILKGYEPFKGPLEKLRKGSLISTAIGETTSYALKDIEPRGKLFVTPGMKVYPGMIIGEHNREQDLEVNPVKQKAVSNVRTVAKDEKVQLVPVESLGLERLMSYIQDDEVIEVTPVSIRSRKKTLDSTMRKSQMRRGQGTDFGNIEPL
ncbi:P-loop containing nucleoside triphosphate hydrolase protein [Chytriomyces sp. MP71]|nr:P-loop containing nucleoside triphosphate hydrolase protein [Chytriomyces sp. MP71]